MNTQERLVLSGKLCPYCNHSADLVDAVEIYGADYRGKFWMYLCRSCGAYVGTHAGTTRALGRLANAELREWKKRAHYYFDPLWRQKMRQGFSKAKARCLAYQWLASKLGTTAEKTHIGMFDIVQCKQVVEVCRPFRNSSGKPPHFNGEMKASNFSPAKQGKRIIIPC